jgi:hypothetical protein
MMVLFKVEHGDLVDRLRTTKDPGVEFIAMYQLDTRRRDCAPAIVWPTQIALEARLDYT